MSDAKDSIGREAVSQEFTGKASSQAPHPLADKAPSFEKETAERRRETVNLA
jgi:hypothetical protein